MSAAGRTVTIEHIEQGDESKKTQKMDDKSEHEQELDIEEHEKVDTEACEKTTDDEETEDEPSIVEFEDPVYELSQAHEMAGIEEKMTEVSKIIEERTKARAPSLPVDLIRRHVQEEPTGRQELH